MPDLFYIIFLFLLGACVGSFLNVVVGRFPWEDTGKSFPWLRAISSPPSHCPKCGHFLAWYDNIPVLGWILLRGQCRYCHKPISIRYPIIEAITGLLFVLFYWLFFMVHTGPCAPEARFVGYDLFGQRQFAHLLPTAIDEHWPLFALYLFMTAALIVITLIDAERFEIPISLPWLMAGLGILVHALVDTPTTPGALNLVSGLRLSAGAALAAGGGAGLLISMLLRQRNWLRPSFAEGEPFLEIDEEAYKEELAAAKRENREPLPRPKVYTKAEIRREISREMLFLMPPLLGAAAWYVLTTRVAAVESAWQSLAKYNWVSGALGAVLGALVGALVVWLARIFGTLGFGRLAMGLGDVHLMFGVGAIIGAGPATLAFFLAPFAALVWGFYRLFSRGKWELPFGPFLSMGSVAAIFLYCDVAKYLAPGIEGLRLVFSR